jgi:uncharacterized protein YacL
MTPERTINLLRILFIVFTGTMGLVIGANMEIGIGTGISAGLAFGLLVVLADRLLKGITLRIFSSATFGLFVGFLFARLLLASNLLRDLHEDAAWLTGLAVYATFAYLGMMLAIRSNRDEFSLIIPYVRFRRATMQDDPVVVDSNIIIDGRLPELCATGFVAKALIVPRFVLDEVQRLSDSADPQKRDRGRLALNNLEALQRNPSLIVTIHDGPADPETAVDTRLIHTARVLNAPLLTNDGNLSAIARLQGVPVLNLHDLARALRPVVEPGRPLDITLVKEGRDPHQAVGYLSDGTMIVVNHARAHIGHTVSVVITTTLQTSAGRLFFAELKSPAAA